MCRDPCLLNCCLFTFLLRYIAMGHLWKFGFPQYANMWKLEWNDEMAYLATIWANQCTGGHDVPMYPTCTHPSTRQQNVARDETAGFKTLWEMYEDNLKGFFNESDGHLRQNVSNYQQGSHFVTIAWAEVASMGVGSTKFLIPSTGWVSLTQSVYNFAAFDQFVPGTLCKEGPPCTQCPDDRVCDASGLLCERHKES